MSLFYGGRESNNNKLKQVTSLSLFSWGEREQQQKTETGDVAVTVFMGQLKQVTSMSLFSWGERWRREQQQQTETGDVAVTVFMGVD